MSNKIQWSFDNINEHDYTNIVNNKTKWCKDIDLALKITEKFIIQNGLILVGGQAIQYALLLKGHKGIYPENEWPDLDCISDNHQQYAFMLAEILCKEKIPHVVSIIAFHIQTMKTRIYQGIDAMDLSYVPENIFKIIDKNTLTYKNNLKIIHPHFQMIDQHRSLSLPLENEPRYTMDFRWTKDMARYDLLYSKYPLNSKPISKAITEQVAVTFKLDKTVCYSGITGLAYWLSKAKKMKLTTDLDLKFNINAGIITYNTPKDYKIITSFDDNLTNTLKSIKGGTHTPNYLMDTVITTQEIGWSDDWADNWPDEGELYGGNVLQKDAKLQDDSKKNDKNKRKEKTLNIKYYATLLGKMPRRVVISDQYEIYDNLGQRISCYIDDTEMQVANLQNIMMYLLERYLFHEIFNISSHDKQIFSALYMQCFKIVSQASYKYAKNDKTYGIFLPIGIEEAKLLVTYGKENYTEGKHFSKMSLKYRLGIGASVKNLRPQAAYLTLIDQCKTDATFNPESSYLFDIGGNETKPF